MMKGHRQALTARCTLHPALRMCVGGRFCGCRAACPVRAAAAPAVIGVLLSRLPAVPNCSAGLLTNLIVMQDLMWSYDGTRIVTCSADNTVRAWDAETGQQSKKMKEHTSYVNRCGPFRRRSPSRHSEPRRLLPRACLVFAAHPSHLQQRVRLRPATCVEPATAFGTAQRVHSAEGAAADCERLRRWLGAAVGPAPEGQPADTQREVPGERGLLGREHPHARPRSALFSALPAGGESAAAPLSAAAAESSVSPGQATRLAASQPPC